mgnify:CR=1 FL=1
MIASHALSVARLCLFIGLVISSAHLTGCSVLRRDAVPENLVNIAQPAGFDGIRFWGDGGTEELKKWMAESLDRQRAILVADGIEQLPSVSYLALSGGGENGAYGAGLLCGWTVRGDRPEFRVVTGVSAGALIAPFAFAGPEYDHVLRDVFSCLRSDQIIKSRNLFDGLLSDGLFDTGPLRKLIEKYVDQAFLDRIGQEHRKGRGLWIATTNLDAQRPIVWFMGRIAESKHPDALKLFQDIMIASASIPGAFPPVMISVEAQAKTYDEMHVDGGATSQVFLYPASFNLSEFAKKFGATRERHTYIIRNARIDPEYLPVRRRTLAIAQRSVSSLISSQGVGDLYRMYLQCLRDDIEFNLASIPDDIDVNHAEMFDATYMTKLFEHAYQKALAGYPWQKSPPGFQFTAPTEPPAPVEPASGVPSGSEGR